ncbi:Clp protease N-terminal domain-containing protein [Amycolatopsis sp. NPDC021455]|uniref:Clp protease N-terminal domain-containing protein n=1 Tax=Amycolatopsis sp. NPDC021455 TaxID=3154901 RepID=UPI0033DC94FA
MPEQAIEMSWVLHRATSAAHDAGGPITVEHLAFGLLTAGESRALRVLSELGVDPAALVERFRPGTRPGTESAAIETFLRVLKEERRVELTPEAQALVDQADTDRDCSSRLLLALAESGALPVSPDDVREELARDPVEEPETLFPPAIRKLNALIAQARQLKEAAVDAHDHERAAVIREGERAAMRRRAELLAEWAGQAQVAAMVEEIEKLRALVRHLRG